MTYPHDRIENYVTDNATQHEGDSTRTSQRLYREAEMLTLGVGGAFAYAIKHPTSKLTEGSLSLATGIGLGVVNHLGTSGKVVAAGIGLAMLAKTTYDEVKDSRWSKFGGAVKDAWSSGANREADIATTKNSLGSFAVDTAIGAAGMGLGGALTDAYAPRESLIKPALARADRDGGAALLSLQNRFEKPSSFQMLAAGKGDLITHTEPAVPGSPRGDLVRVDTTPEGKLLMAAMDVEGHGLSAAKKAITVHGAMDKVLPDTNGKSASEILGMIDNKLSSKDELSITAALATYDPKTRTLQTARASSELAYVVRADGTVQPLDSEGGLALGTELYNLIPQGNHITTLNKGDTVVMASDGVFDRFGYGNEGKGFVDFLKSTGPNPEAIRRGIIAKGAPVEGADDTSFIVFRPLQ